MDKFSTSINLHPFPESKPEPETEVYEIERLKHFNPLYKPALLQPDNVEKNETFRKRLVVHLEKLKHIVNEKMVAEIVPGSQKKYLKHAAKPRVAVSMVLSEDKTEIMEIEEILAEEDEEGFPIAKQQHKCVKLQRETSYESSNMEPNALNNNNPEIDAENVLSQLMIKNEEIHIKEEEAENTDQDKKVQSEILPIDLNKRVKQDKKNGGQGKGKKVIARPTGQRRGLGLQIHHCTICGYQTTKPYDFTRHLRIHNRDDCEKYSCPKCIFQTIWKQKFDLHMRRHDGFILKTETCKTCKFETARKDGLKGHVCKIKGFTCHDCGFQTTTKPLIRKHVETHRPFVEKPFKCNVCIFESKYKDHLKTHMQRHKQGDARKFKCNECTFKTCQKGNLMRHWSVKHGDCKSAASFVCFHCNFRTYQKYNLKMHLLTHNERNREEAKTLRCFECDYTCIYKTALKAHLWKHKKPNEIPMVKCTKCSYRTIRKSDLNRHFRTHKS